MDDYSKGAAAWDKAMDKYLKGEGPSPGAKNEFIQKQNKDRPTYAPAKR